MTAVLRALLELLFCALFFTQHHSREFPVGVLLSDNNNLPYDYTLIEPAIDLAIERAANEYNITFIKEVEIYQGIEGGCNRAEATGRAAILVFRKNVSLFIGPACTEDLMSAGRVATYFKVAMITGGADLIGSTFEIKTLTRVSFNIYTQWSFFISILQNFNWTYVAIIYNYSDTRQNKQAEGLVSQFRDNGYPTPADIRYNDTKTDADIKILLTTASKSARILVILGTSFVLRRMMLMAKDLHMTSGDYTYFTVELFKENIVRNFQWRIGEGRDADVQEAFKSLMIISLKPLDSPKFKKFEIEVKERFLSVHKVNYPGQVNYYVGSFYDGLMMHTAAVNETLAENGDPYDGITMEQEKTWNCTYDGVTGKVYINPEGDRVDDYVLYDMTNPQTGEFTIVARYFGYSRKYEETAPIMWPNKENRPPLNRPKCGFTGDDPICLVKDKTPVLQIAIGVSVSLLSLICLIGFLVYRKIKIESELAMMDWLVTFEDVILSQVGRSVMMMNKNSISTTFTTSLSRNTLRDSLKDVASMKSDDERKQETPSILVGSYKGITVAIRKCSTQKIELNRELLLEVKLVKDTHHENLLRFMGACIEAPNVVVLTEYCSKGTLQDILQNDAFKLDWMFKYSLIQDITKGMIFLHSTSIGFHGRLTSDTCLIDSRFVLKIGDFGLPTFYNNEEIDEHELCTKYLWRAPELLRSDFKCGGTQEGDVYSFAIILQEIALRAEPYASSGFCAEEIIKKVRTGLYPPFRPVIEPDICPPQILNMIEKCWHEIPINRPSFLQIKTMLKSLKIDGGEKGNIMDNLLARMEQYASNLEKLVEERTEAFLEEKKKSEALLYQVLPQSVAEQLKRGEAVQPETFDTVTIYFSDIVGFTVMSAESTPMQVVDFLNDLYTCFDAIINEFDVYKVETIGDAYMVVSGLPIRNGIEHGREIARMSLKLLSVVNTFKIRHKPEQKLMLRIGIHSGSCVAGVVGLKMPRYCLFGDTVNTASRMESTGQALKIHVSPETKKYLDFFGTFVLEDRGEIPVKGKGNIKTYWLLREDPL